MQRLESWSLRYIIQWYIERFVLYLLVKLRCGGMVRHFWERIVSCHFTDGELKKRHGSWQPWYNQRFHETGAVYPSKIKWQFQRFTVTFKAWRVAEHPLKNLVLLTSSIKTSRQACRLGFLMYCVFQLITLDIRNTPQIHYDELRIEEMHYINCIVQ